MSDLVEFLRARLDHETADLADYDGSYNDVDGCWGQHVDPTFARADVEAKRAIVTEYEQAERYGRTAWGQSNADQSHTRTLLKVARLLALPYADHPDYRPEWRP